MSKAKFTSEQQQLLRNNPYTVRVTEDVLYLSKECKELFYKEYLTGAIPRISWRSMLTRQPYWGNSVSGGLVILSASSMKKPENSVMPAPRIHP